MSIHQEFHRAHLARRLAWNAISVDDDGIDLKRVPRHVVLRDARPSSPSLRFASIEPPRIVPIMENAPEPVVVPVVAVPSIATLSIHGVVRRVARHFGLTMSEIQGESRELHYVRPRQVAAYVARYALGPTRASYPKIGKALGDRDHTTVMSSVRKVQRLMAADQHMRSSVEYIIAEISR